MKLYAHIPIHFNYYNYVVKNNTNNSFYQFKSKYYNFNLQTSFTAIDILNVFYFRHCFTDLIKKNTS